MNISSCWAGSPLVYSVCDIVGLDYYSTGYTVVSRSTHWGAGGVVLRSDLDLS